MGSEKDHGGFNRASIEIARLLVNPRLITNLASSPLLPFFLRVLRASVVNSSFPFRDYLVTFVMSPCIFPLAFPGM